VAISLSRDHCGNRGGAKTNSSTAWSMSDWWCQKSNHAMQWKRQTCIKSDHQRSGRQRYTSFAQRENERAGNENRRACSGQVLPAAAGQFQCVPPKSYWLTRSPAGAARPFALVMRTADIMLFIGGSKSTSWESAAPVLPDTAASKFQITT
jgi:hypothetical protein